MNYSKILALKPITLRSSDCVPLAEVFPTESHWREFLHQNLDDFTALIGVALKSSVEEMPMGNLRFDLLVDTADGRRVLAELQYGRGDHRHLGQIVSYTASIQPDLTVWIAEGFKPEDIQTIRQLNDSGFGNIIAVEVALHRINRSDKQLLILSSRIVAGELDETEPDSPGPANARETKYAQFWNALNTQLGRNQYYSATESRQKRKSASWNADTGIEFRISLRGETCNIAVAVESRIREAEYCRLVYEEIRHHRHLIEETLGETLNWDDERFALSLIVPDTGYQHANADELEAAVRKTANAYERLQAAVHPILQNIPFKQLDAQVKAQANAKETAEESEEQAAVAPQQT